MALRTFAKKQSKESMMWTYGRTLGELFVVIFDGHVVTYVRLQTLAQPLATHIVALPREIAFDFRRVARNASIVALES
jgi:hypothetical protein